MLLLLVLLLLFGIELLLLITKILLICGTLWVKGCLLKLNKLALLLLLFL